MKRLLLLWILEGKCLLKRLPGMMAVVFVLLALLTMAGIGCLHLLEKDAPVMSVTVALIADEPAGDEAEDMTKLALAYVEGMESFSSFCRIRSVSEEEAFRMLETGEAAAALRLPERVVEGILSGENRPVSIYFPQDAGIETALFQELADAGVQMLQTAQAQIYGAGDTMRAYGMTEKISVLEGEINRSDLAFALDRLALYQTEQVNASGSVTLEEHLTASGFVYFLLLLGMVCYPIMRPYSMALQGQLRRWGIGSVAPMFGQWCMGLAVLMIGGVGYGFFVRRLDMLISGMQIFDVMNANEIDLLSQFTKEPGVILLILVSINMWIMLLTQIISDETAYILFVFLVSTIMTYVSGGFIPMAYLPEAVRQIGEFCPVAYLIEAVESLYLTGLDNHILWLLALYSCCFGLSAGIWRYVSQSKHLGI